MVTTKISSLIVKPAEQTPQEVMYLSECDQIKALTHAPVVYFYRNSNRKTLSEITQIVTGSLSKALVTFYPLAGRLHWSDQKSGRVELHCNSMGALFVEAESDLGIEDFGDFRPDSEMRSLIPSVDLSATPIEAAPLLLVQITRLRCGGVAMGTGASHVVVDGRSAEHFVSEWAKIARGEELPDNTNLPFLDRTVLLQKHEIDNHHNLKSRDFFHHPLILGRSDNLEERKKDTTVIMLKLTQNRIETLKIRASTGLESFSRFEAVSAHIWRCLTKARGLKPEQETVAYVTVDFRRRVNPPLPERYFGNAVMPLPICSSAGELLSGELSDAARKIQAGIRGVGDEKARSYLSCIRNMADISGKRQFHTVGCAQGAFYGNPNLLVTSWIGIPFYDANMWGDEVFYMGPGSLGYDGRVFLIRDPNEIGSFLVPVRVQAEHADALQKIFNEEI